jgi:TolB-like protein
MDQPHMKFGPFIYDGQRKVLTRRGLLVPLGQKTIALLEALLDAGGKPVSKSDLLEAGWPGLSVEESNLTVQIAALRKNLGTAEDGMDWITTVQRVGYQLRLPAAPGATPIDASQNDASVGSPGKPSIAVMPFLNLSSDPEQDYFSDGIVEEIIIALSQMRWLLVIARNSSFAYKGQTIDVKQVGKELGVRYVLEGTVRRSENRVRITAQLSESGAATNIWAGRFDGGREDIFDLQDRLAASVIGAIAPKLEAAEIERVSRKPTDHLGAYDHFLRGMMEFHRWSRDSSARALSHFHRAIELDPAYASAYGLAARTYVQRNSGGWMEDRDHERAEAIRMAGQAAVLGRDDAVPLAMAGFAISDIAGRVEDGDALIDRALSLNSNLAWAWLYSSWVKTSLGQPDRAIERVARAIELSPNDPQSFSFYAARAFAQLMAGQYQDAFVSAEEALRGRPDFLLYIAIAAASAALLGRRSDVARLVERLNSAHPAATVGEISTLFPLLRPGDLERWTEGLRKAGVAE